MRPHDLPVNPGMLGLGEAMVEVVLGAGHLEGMGPDASFRSIMALISARLQLSPLGSVKWVPLSVSAVWITSSGLRTALQVYGAAHLICWSGSTRS